MRLLAAMLLVFFCAGSAQAQITTEPDEGFIQLSPQQKEVITQEETKKFVIQGGEDSYVPAPRTTEVPAEVIPEAKVATPEGDTEDAKEDSEKPKEKPKGGMEVCDIVAQIIARDFRVIVANPHMRALDVPTIGSGPYDVAIKSILPYSNVYTAMGCDGRALQVALADTLRKAVKQKAPKKDDGGQKH